jgi:hypothetical protein
VWYLKHELPTRWKFEGVEVPKEADVPRADKGEEPEQRSYTLKWATLQSRITFGPKLQPYRWILATWAKVSNALVCRAAFVSGFKLNFDQVTRNQRHSAFFKGLSLELSEDV